jgi:hypothetical protein
MKAKLFLVKKPADPQTAYEDHRAALLADLAPQGPLQMADFERLVHSSWIMRSCRIREAEILARGAEVFRNGNSARTLDYLHRRAQAAERVYYRALKGLQVRKP